MSSVRHLDSEVYHYALTTKLSDTIFSIKAYRISSITPPPVRLPTQDMTQAHRWFRQSIPLMTQLWHPHSSLRAKQQGGDDAIDGVRFLSRHYRDEMDLYIRLLSC
jgi:hypothetical protein